MTAYWGHYSSSKKNVKNVIVYPREGGNIKRNKSRKFTRTKKIQIFICACVIKGSILY